MCQQVAAGSGACGLFTQGGGGLGFVWRCFGREPQHDHPNVAPRLMWDSALAAGTPVPTSPLGGGAVPPPAWPFALRRSGVPLGSFKAVANVSCYLT